MNVEAFADHLQERWAAKKCLWVPCDKTVSFRTGRGPKAHFCSAKHKANFAAKRGKLLSDRQRIDDTLASEELDSGMQQRLKILRQAICWQLTAYAPPGPTESVSPTDSRMSS